jgi:hypothetical protein
VSLSADELVLLLRWLDAALDIPEHARDAWLEQLELPHETLRRRLREMLAQSEEALNASVQTLPCFVDPGLEVEGADGHRSVGLEGRTVGPHRLLHEIGRGRMSIVYLASRADETIKRNVALKLPHVHVDGRRFAERYIRERDILAQLAHPLIARLYDAGTSAEGQPYLAMEFIDGLPITPRRPPQNASAVAGVKMPHLAVAGRGDDYAVWRAFARRSADSLSRQLLPTNLSRFP